eukprot:SAG31_NODE_43865_length_265_cov_0.626506_1_plen_88_part_11
MPCFAVSLVLGQSTDRTPFRAALKPVAQSEIAPVLLRLRLAYTANQGALPPLPSYPRPQTAMHAPTKNALSHVVETTVTSLRSVITPF